jgi:hypothetical protein
MMTDVSRIGGIIIGGAAMMTLAGWIIGATLMLRVDRLAAQLALVQTRLGTVAPREVLCSLAHQMGELHVAVSQHCDTAHHVKLAPLAVPAQCISPAAPAGE